MERNEALPAIHQIPLGLDRRSADPVADQAPTGFITGGVVKWATEALLAQNKRINPLMIQVENFGDTSFNFSIQEASDNKKSSYATITVREGGADYNFAVTLPVTPGAKVVLLIERNDVAQDYLGFFCESTANGRVTIVAFGERLELLERVYPD